MMIRFVFLLSAIILTSVSAEAGEVVGSRLDTARVSTNQTAPFGKYLLCLNSISKNARRLKLGVTSQAPRTERDTAIFYGQASDRSGVLMISPNVATLDEVPLYTPPKGKGNHEYPLSIPHPDGGERLVHYYVEGERGVAAGIGPLNSKEFKDANAGVPFYRLGKPTSKIKDEDAIEALSEESRRAINTVPVVLANRKEALKRRMGEGIRTQNDEERVRSEVREALCNCLKTGHPIIMEAANRVGNALKMDDLTKCEDPYISRSAPLFDLLVSKSHASSSQKTSVGMDQRNSRIDLPQMPQEIKIIKNNLYACSFDQAVAVDMPSARIERSGGGCRQNRSIKKACGSVKGLHDSIKDPANACSSSNGKTLVATPKGVYLFDQKTKDNELISDTGAGDVAYSEHWMAWAQSATIQYRK